MNDLIKDSILETDWDVAYTKWGKGARLPSLSNLEELYENCQFKSGLYNDIQGVYITGPNNNSIFIPFAGYKWDAKNMEESNLCAFWIGEILHELYETYYTPSFIAQFEKGHLKVGGDLLHAYVGLSVRAVKDKDSTEDQAGTVG